jgi:hypothetical protein
MLGKTEEYLLAAGLHIFEVDGTFLSTHCLHGWRALTMVTTTGNHEVLPIAMLICSSENETNFVDLMQRVTATGLRCELQQRDVDRFGRVASIRDGATAINNAIDTVCTWKTEGGQIKHLPFQMTCEFHLTETCKKRFPLAWPKARPHFLMAVQARTRAMCDFFLAQARLEAGHAVVDFIETHPRHHWAVSTICRVCRH